MVTVEYTHTHTHTHIHTHILAMLTSVDISATQYIHVFDNLKTAISSHCDETFSSVWNDLNYRFYKMHLSRVFPAFCPMTAEIGSSSPPPVT